MIVCIRGEEGESDTTTRRISTANNTLAEVFVPQGSPNSVNMVKHVVIVMDALKGFSREPLQWALDHVIRTRCSLTLLGVMPWLPLPCNFAILLLIPSTTTATVLINFLFFIFFSFLLWASVLQDNVRCLDI